MSARRLWALPLVPLYAAALVAKEELRRLGSPPQKSLVWPVVSVGSVSAGGAGKTPVVIALAKLLTHRGRHVDVLSRGYRREGAEIACVDVQKPTAARFFGDEPLMIARTTGVPVWVGANRFAAGQMAESAVPHSNETLGVHLLDDGFQHRRLKRNIDIALVTAEDLADSLLPAGNLRESLHALNRADVIVIREEERQAVEPRVTTLMRSGALLWSIHRRLRFPAPLGVLSAGLRPLAFCAIARPDGFATMLQQAGCGIIDTVVFDDHHAYTMHDVEQLKIIAKDLHASGFVTTEKDAVKLSPALRAQLETLGPVVVIPLEAEFVYPERVARELEARLA
jgi:tetraacyldisaccharide 4'-kinase